MNNNGSAGDTEEDRVARFLAENPDWLATQTDLYEVLSPPRRVHGDTLADHMAAMIDAARQQAASMTAQAETLLQAGRAALGLADRVREAVLALIRATDLGECIACDLPRLLGIDSALLWIEGAGARPAGAADGAQPAARHGGAPARPARGAGQDRAARRWRATWRGRDRSPPTTRCCG